MSISSITIVKIDGVEHSQCYNKQYCNYNNNYYNYYLSS